MRLAKGAEVISLIIPQSQQIDVEEETESEAAVESTGENANAGQIYILTASENGYGKRTRLEEFPLRGRGGQGVIAMQTSERNGSLVAAMQVYPSDEMMLITDRGTLVRTRVEEVSSTSRNTQGVMLIRLGENEKLVKTVRIDELEDEPLETDDALETDAALETPPSAEEQAQEAPQSAEPNSDLQDDSGEDQSDDTSL